MRKFAEEPVGVTARNLVTGDRQKDYGDPLDNLATIATGWSQILGVEVTPRHVSHMMIWLKMMRDQNGNDSPNAQRDNEVDICGYAHLLQFEREERNGNKPKEPKKRAPRKPKEKELSLTAKLDAPASLKSTGHPNEETTR